VGGLASGVTLPPELVIASAELFICRSFRTQKLPLRGVFAVLEIYALPAQAGRTRF